MRTRIYNKMTSYEIEDYLKRGGDTIFLGIGVVECHGYMPVDVEAVGPEAKAVLLAEKADGLALINLPYFYPGGTIISPATSMAASAHSSMKIPGCTAAERSSSLRKSGWKSVR